MKEKRGDAFSDCHPAVNFFWFAAVILITMLNSHPVFLGISFLGAFCYASRLQGWQRVLKFNLLATLPAMIIVAFINPAFNHYGVTMLFYLKTGPVTLEAIVYGLVLASMLFISILWFSCYNKVMTTDKFVYLFGRVIPALSLVLSMVFRFVPRFGHIFKKMRHGITIFSVLVTWALENAIDTSDSMRARGYGLKGRSAFAIFRFDNRDGIVTGTLLALMGVYFGGMAAGISFAQYDPQIKIGGLPLTPLSVIIYVAWAGFCFFPVILGVLEDRRFEKLKKMADMERRLPWYLTDPKKMM